MSITNNFTAFKKETMEFYQHKELFQLESGETIKDVQIAYQTWGSLNEAKDNVIWICHALTASSDAREWWKGLIGDDAIFDTKRYFIVCDNILGSCYGTTGPSSKKAGESEPYYSEFPFITIRDMVQAHELLRQHLGINQIYLLAGGSMGGYQALEWCVMKPGLIKHQFLIATSAKETAWGIAIHTAQRMAIELDSTWKEATTNAGKNGLKAARAIGMLSYRSYEAFVKTQSEKDDSIIDNFKASSYIKYQGDKLANRFSAHSYWLLTKAMDTHNLPRNRGNIEQVLKKIEAKTLVIGISSDLLCPLQEQKFIAAHIPDASFVSIDSLFGHDGFLVETEAISQHLSTWLKQ